MKKWILAASVLLVGLGAQAQDAGSSSGPNAILGQWFSETKDAKTEVYKTQKGTYEGKVVWLETGTNSDGTEPRLDEMNEDEGLRNQPLMNMVVVKDLTWNEEDQEWQGGTYYDFNSGRTYECYGEMREDGTVYFKKYVLGISWLGTSTIWSRN